MTKLTTEEFIQKANQIHNNKYDYSLVDYKSCKEKVKIICPIHGEFEQTPDQHLNKKNGCPLCANEIRNRNRKKTIEQFIKEANQIHNNKYDYSLAIYKNNCSKIEIICPIHGVFKQSPTHHLQGCGCPKCKGDLISEKLRGDWGSLKKLFEEKYGDKYDYSYVNYKSVDTKIQIYCNKCKSFFWQTPYNHLTHEHRECCSCSKGEEKIRNFLIKEGLKQNEDFFKEYHFEDLKVKNFLRFDFYIPSKNLLIEYNGKQHYEFPNTLHKTKKEFEEQKRRDCLKKEYAEKNNIELLEIKYLDEDRIETILKEKINYNA